MNQEETRANAFAGDQHPDDDDYHHHPPPKFAVDDKVYGVQHPPAAHQTKGQRSSSARCSSYYEAVVRQSEFDFTSGTWLYLIHYLGWNHRWDEWMDVTQLLTPSEYQQLNHDEQQQENSNNHAAAAAEYDPRATRSLSVDTNTGMAVALASSNNNNANTATIMNNTTTTGSKRNRMSDPSPANNNSTAARKRVRTLRRSNTPGGDRYCTWTYAEYCELPLTLQTVLVEESERLTTMTTHPRWVHTLPAAVPVSKVLQHFAKKKCKELLKQQQQSLENKNSTSNKSNPALTPEVVQAFVEGLAQLFNEALPACLLYPQERLQYEAWVLQQQLNNGTASSSPVDCYGCEYLLRLLVRLPMLLQQQQSHSTTNSPSQQQHRMVGPLLTELIVLMQKNRSALFAATSNYRRPEPHETGEQPPPLPPPKQETMMDTTK